MEGEQRKKEKDLYRNSAIETYSNLHGELIVIEAEFYKEVLLETENERCQLEDLEPETGTT